MAAITSAASTGRAFQRCPSSPLPEDIGPPSSDASAGTELPWTHQPGGFCNHPTALTRMPTQERRSRPGNLGAHNQPLPGGIYMADGHRSKPTSWATVLVLIVAFVFFGF